MRSKELQLVPVEEKAIELYANYPEITHQEVANRLGINEKTLRKLRRNPEFWEKYYSYYMVEFTRDVVDGLRAMTREMKAGNVQAGRLVLEHSGKLQNNTKQALSPFEMWAMAKIEKDVSDKEVILDTEDAEIIEEMPEFKNLPPRTADNSPGRAKKELISLNKAMNKAKNKKKRNEARKVLRKWQKRAELVGIAPLPAKRPTPGQRDAWRESIIAAEKKASQHPLEQADSNSIPCKPKNQKQENLKPPTPPKI